MVFLRWQERCPYLQFLLQILLTTAPAQDQITVSLVIALDLLNFRQIHGIQLDRPLQHRSAAARVATQLWYYQLQSNLQQATSLALLVQMFSRNCRHLMPTLLWYSLVPLTALAIRRPSLMAVTLEMVLKLILQLALHLGRRSSLTARWLVDVRLVTDLQQMTLITWHMQLLMHTRYCKRPNLPTHCPGRNQIVTWLFQVLERIQLPLLRFSWRRMLLGHAVRFDDAPGSL